MTRKHITHRTNRRKAIKARVRFNVFERDGFRCRYCGRSAETDILHIDHVTPVSLGGDNSIDNLVTACATCNFGKSDREIETEEERFSQWLHCLIWPVLRWPASERDAAIVVLARMAAVGHSHSSLVEIARASDDLADIKYFTEWLAENGDEE